MAVRTRWADIDQMEFIGIIESKPDPPGIDRSRWLALISSRDDLVPPEARVVTTPFTGQALTVFGPDTTAQILIDGRPAGTIEWPDREEDLEENFLIVWGAVPTVRHIAEQIADSLGGSFRTADEFRIPGTA